MAILFKLNTFSFGFKHLHIYKKAVKTGKLNNIISDFTLYYKNGSNENLSEFLSDCTEESLVNCQNLLRKYIVVDNTSPEMNPNIEMMGVGVYPIVSPGVLNNTEIIYNQNYNPSISENEQNNYSGNGNIYANVNNQGNNINYQVQPDLNDEDDTTKLQ